LPKFLVDGAQASFRQEIKINVEGVLCG